MIRRFELFIEGETDGEVVAALHTLLRKIEGKERYASIHQGTVFGHYSIGGRPDGTWPDHSATSKD